ncbi:GntR family transcriptional regulator [Marinilactibacillus sp. XAAS-LB27]|uniref:GntR family transcriptional regulator n=1 Tax=Marinilactibacillus sp. XAAS-LB27 TaxID=3114538 RepID=UPI002E188BBC|nr:GntR family transcriptional regulator [Marinilactibacillus sp. XAAS-LB27]
MNEPLYKTIADELTKDIVRGYYQKGTKIPTEAKLCDHYHVSRVTIRQAIQLLVERQFVRKTQGSGTEVIYFNKNTIMNRSADVLSFTDEMHLLGRKASSKVTKFELSPASEQLREELFLEPDSMVFYYERVLYGDDFPYCFERGYMPCSYFPDFSVAHLTQSKMLYIEEIRHYKISYSHQVVHAISSNKQLQKALKIEIDQPLLEVTHVTYSDENLPLEKTIVTFDSTTYQAHFVKKRV